MKALVCIAVTLLALAGCGTTPPTDDTTQITAADVARLPPGQRLQVDLQGDTSYLIDIRDPATRDRVELRYGDQAITVGAWLRDAEQQNPPVTALVEPGGCAGGWELRCQGNVCCTVCQATGQIGDCAPVTQ